MDKNEIKKLLPHRDPFLMVDKVVSHTDTQIECELFLDETLPFFKGHFPNQPIMPGVLTCEALAQTGGILLALKNGKNGKPVIGQVTVINPKNKAAKNSEYGFDII